jgi:type II secretory pathway component PulM
MILSKRERMIAMTVTIVVALFLLDSYVVRPVLASRANLIEEVQRKSRAKAVDDRLLARHPELLRRWQEMRATGLASDPTTVGRQLQDAVRSWAGQSGLNITDMVLSPTPQKDQEFMKLSLKVTGSGNIEAVTRFLYQMQRAAVPVRVGELSIQGPRDATGGVRGGRDPRESSQILTMTMTLTTIYMPETEANRVEASAPPRETKS